jgi:glyoxylase-like metal-dependent hydrolase (beta-lactamase superfamily II)
MLVAPGVHRLSFSVDTKPMSMYLLEGDQLILIDSGLQDTPESIYLPAISELGRTADEVGLIFITHADADHIGGNAAARHLFPNARFVCHVNDQRWASDPAVIMAERYDGFRQYGLHYGQAVFNMLGGWMGPAEPMDILVRGGERFRRQEDDWLSVFHVPGHTPGHIWLCSNR